jgi:hypothetical protein
MCCFTYCLVDIVFVIGSDVHADTKTNGNKTAIIIAPEAPVQLKVPRPSTERRSSLDSQATGVLRLHIFLVWYSLFYLRYDMWRIVCQPSVVVRCHWE